MPVTMIKRIQRWHWGKVVILWAWGGFLVVLLLTRFLSQQVEVDPAISSLAFLGSLLTIGAQTIVTWLWLGGKEDKPTEIR